MQYRLRVQEPVATVDEFRAERTQWVDHSTIWAERVKDTGFRSRESGELFSDHRAEYNIRSAHKIGENWRVEEIGGYTYTVIAVIHNRRRGMSTLICERVNK